MSFSLSQSMNITPRLCNTSSVLLRRGPDAPGWIRHFSARAQLRTCSNQTAKSSSSEWTFSGNWVTPLRRQRLLWGRWASAQTRTPCWESWSRAGPAPRLARPLLTAMRGAQAKRTPCCLPARPPHPAESRHISGTGRTQTQTWGLLLSTAAMLPWGNLSFMGSQIMLKHAPIPVRKKRHNIQSWCRHPGYSKELVEWHLSNCHHSFNSDPETCVFLHRHVTWLFRKGVLHPACACFCHCCNMQILGTHFKLSTSKYIWRLTTEVTVSNCPREGSLRENISKACGVYTGQLNFYCSVSYLFLLAIICAHVHSPASFLQSRQQRSVLMPRHPAGSELLPGQRSYYHYCVCSHLAQGAAQTRCPNNGWGYKKCATKRKDSSHQADWS